MIVVAGDALIDLIVGPDRRLAPVAGGGSYNTARAIARLGVPVRWAGALSDDRFGRLLEAGLASDGVGLDLVERTPLPTTLALAEIDDGGTATYRFYVEGTSMPSLGPGPFRNGLPAGTLAVHLGTLGLVLEPAATTLEALADALPADVLLLVDPNCRPSITTDPAAWRARMDRVIARADIVKASVDDLAFLLPGVAAPDAARRLLGLGPRAVLLTDGARPLTVVTPTGTWALPVPRVPIVDTIGAGDTFGGAVLALLVHEGRSRDELADPDPILRAAAFGIRASGLACGRLGADPPTLADLGGWPG